MIQTYRLEMETRVDPSRDDRDIRLLGLSYDPLSSRVGEKRVVDD